MVLGKNLFHHEGHDPAEEHRGTSETRRKNKRTNKNYLKGISAISGAAEGGEGRIENQTSVSGTSSGLSSGKAYFSRMACSIGRKSG
jgi:hypothetical protein